MSESKFEKLLVERDGQLYLQHPKTVTTTLLRKPHREVCLGTANRQEVMDALQAIVDEEEYQINFGWSMTFETYEVGYHLGQYSYKDFDDFMGRYKEFLLANADYIKQHGHPPLSIDPEAMG